MANSNVNIANKLYAYIKHGVDISPEIKERYNSSMIFIGDEQQIYVPVMDTYVGIGMTAYNATINRIASVEEQLRQLAENLATDLVTKIYADYSLKELSEGGMIEGGLPEGFSDDSWALNNDITIKGINDYNPDTHYARRRVDGEIITLTNANGNTANLISNGTVDIPPYSQNTDVTTYVNATSGITITPHWGNKIRTENPVTHQVFEKRTGNYITIDDKLTWSYMTSAYSYSLAFAQNYTASEIDRVYHNLLGESEVTYNPISFRSFVDDVTSEFSAYTGGLTSEFINQYNASHTDTYVVLHKTGDTVDGVYRLDKKSAYVATYTGEDVTTGEYAIDNYYEVTYSDIANVLTGDGAAIGGPNGYILYNNSEVTPVTSNFYQLYERSEQYNSSYNMNIKNGIETLKEVAYLLDLLTDGQLGSVTYYTYAQVNDENSEFNTNSQIPSTYETHWINTDPNWHPNDDDTYAYLVKISDPENLGIQIAYSIAGNQKQIDDLHKHAELLEKGETTLRSIQATNSQFATVSLYGGTTHWTDTDTNQGESNFDTESTNHPNHSTSNTRQENSYLVGDVNIKVTLATSKVYATVNPTNESTPNPEFTDEAGVVWYGCYTAADMDNIVPNPTDEEFDNNVLIKATYYEKGDNNVFTPISSSAIEEGKTYDSRNQSENLQYYWIPNSNLARNDTNQNAVYTKIKVKELLALGDADDVKGTTFKKSTITEFFTFNEKTNEWDSLCSADGDNTAVSKLITLVNNKGIDTNDYVAFISKYEKTVIHTVDDENVLATTEWTEVYVNSKVSQIADDLENILEQAKKYTDDEIAKLDNEYIYSDFETYWTYYVSLNITNNPNLGVEGTPEYVEAYNREYKAFVDNDNDLTRIFDDSYTTSNPGEENPYRLSYITNSQYTYNIIEENGIVTAASRELPSDTLKVNAYIWGSEQSTTRFEYEDISGLSEKDSLLDALYDWKDANQDNQIFVKINDGNTFEPVPTNTDLTGIETANYRVKLDDGRLVPVEAPYNNVPDIYANKNDINWKPLYKKVPRYLELNLANAINPGAIESDQKVEIKENVLINAVLTEVTFTLRKFKSGDYQGKIRVTSSVEGLVDSDNVLKHISAKPADSTKYLSVENKHFSYADNGHGENQFEVTAHITKLEDATPTNTGFADAYDVRTFIENMFKWVDISATISPDTITHRDVFFKNTNLEDVPEGATLYSRTVNNDVVTFTSVNNPAYGWFWLDDNKYFDVASGDSLYSNDVTDTQRGTHIKVAIKDTETSFYLVKRFLDNSTGIKAGDPFSASYNYYINIETAKTNPLNLTETRYGE